MFIPRKQQIFAAEAIAVPEAILDAPEALAGRQVTWYIDNESACSSFIRGASRQEDVSEIIAIALLSVAKINAVIWFEWIDSHSNPSDGLSRLGLQDPWTKSQAWSLLELRWSTNHDSRAQSLRDWRWEVGKI